MDKIKDRFKLPKTKGITCKEPIITQQHHKNECDINQIIAKAKKRGFLIDPLTGEKKPPQYGDFSEARSYHEMQLAIKAADEKFMKLPAALRRQFNHDPAELLAFVENEANYEKAVELNLIPKKPEPIEKPLSEQPKTPETASAV